MIKVVEYDAMNRPTVSTQPDGSVVKVDYNKAGLLETTQTKLRGETNWTDFITDTSYNEKGQKTEIYYGNSSKTKYEYDNKTFRIKNKFLHAPQSKILALSSSPPQVPRCHAEHVELSGVEQG